MSAPKTNIAMVALVVQNAGLILISKYSFRKGAEDYNRAAALFASEILKLLVSALLEIMEVRRGVSRLTKSVRLSPSNLFMLIPATLYVTQNLLQLSAIRGLSPALYVTGAQLKVLTSAVFSVLLLKRNITTRQAVSFFPLMAGVAMVQWDPGDDDQPELKSNSLYSLLSLFAAVTISGFAGVLLELSYKREGESIWVKNMYLSFFSLPAALYATLRDVRSKFPRNDSSNSTILKLTHGFDAVVVMVILLLALGGLLSALVTKLAGTLTKCFAVSISIVVCTVVSAYYGLEQISPRNVVGTFMVIVSVFLYASK